MHHIYRCVTAWIAVMLFTMLVGICPMAAVAETTMPDSSLMGQDHGSIAGTDSSVGESRNDGRISEGNLGRDSVPQVAADDNTRGIIGITIAVAVAVVIVVLIVWMMPHKGKKGGRGGTPPGGGRKEP